MTRLLAVAAEERGIPQVIIERRTGIHQSRLSRSFTGRRVFTIDEASAVCAVLGLSFPAVIREAQHSM